eukprot:g1546.t1
MDKSSEAVIDTDSFAGVMPKEEIGVLRFLKDHPNSDGRGITIAIFDTGIDPGTKGLQITTDGLPKIVDVLDCTGDGDVDTSEVVKADESGCIKGINGKLMKVNPSWSNPTGDWHIGVKPLFNLFSGSLRKRIKETRLKKFHEWQREAVTEATGNLAEFNKTHPTCTEVEDQRWKTELEDRIKLLDSMMSSYTDNGPLLDCVVWHDGETWRAAIDTTDLHEGEGDKGRLEDFIPLASFHEEHQFGTFSSIDACNFVCNIYKNGNLLSIVVDCSSHGTHVAGIAAAYHPEDSVFNGIAPGARILSCKIGDSRMGTMETGVGFVRAIIAAIEYKVDLVNISYGELTAFPNRGRLTELLSELVYKHGIIVVTSAGNNGPGLSTVGSPGSAEALFSVGAFISPSMAEVAHSTRERPAQGQQYTFSARGPTFDGRIGILFSAPGGAISNFPQWTGQSRQLANGTSMASPSGCGGLALILSALKQNGRPYNPEKIRKAIQNSCVMPQESPYSDSLHLTYGHGLLQVDRVWECLKASKDSKHSHVRFNIQVTRSGEAGELGSGQVSSLLKPASGIYFREPHDARSKHTYTCNVTPLLHEDADVFNDQLSVEMKLKLTSSEDWVKCPQLFLLAHQKRSFEIEVDARGLDTGVSFAQITAQEVDDPAQGSLFHVPITIVHPVAVTDSSTQLDLGSFHFSQGTVHRKFVAIPESATWAEITYTGGEFQGSRYYFVDMKYLIPDVRFDDTSSSPAILLTSGQHYISCIPVIGGRTLEICIAQYWSEFENSSVSVSIEFHGVVVNQGKDLVLNGAQGHKRVQVYAPLRREKINPSINLESVLLPLAPTESSITPFTFKRDVLPDSRVIHKLQLTYKLKLIEGGKITPRLHMFNRQVYDCPVEAQMVQIYDTQKKLLLVSDIYPPSTTVKKGDYIIRVLVRHDNPKILKDLQKTHLIVERQLEKSVSVPVYKSTLDSVTGSGNFKQMSLYKGRMVSMVIGPLTAELPKDCTPGTVMKGNINLGQKNQGTGAAHVHQSFTFIVPPTPPSNPENNNTSPETPSLPQRIQNAARDAKVKALEEYNIATEDALKEFDGVLSDLKDQYSRHLPLLTTALKKYDGLGSLKNTAQIKSIINLCDEIISCIDQVELACFIARKSPDESEEGKKRSKEATEEKEALILALQTKLSNNLKQQEETGEVVNLLYVFYFLIFKLKGKIEDIRPIFEELRKWIEPTDASIAVMHAKFEGANGRYANAIKSLDGAISSDKTHAGRDVHEMKIKCLEALGWKHWTRYEQRQIKINFPKNYAPF